ncbi:sporulation protein YqfD [Bacillus sp. FSL M8-0077]|uniref:sporulation protein YqfD n=1 Tax=Bacillus sp. FSL M8-0077 TaxID=2954556 RepID=UPI001152B1F0
MKNKWFAYFIGRVEVEIRGSGIERLINECTRHGITIFQVSRRQDSVRLFIRLSDVHAFRKVRRHHEVKCSFHQKKGFPFLLLWSRRNIGFTLGMAFFLVTILALSNMVWKIEIKGANPETEHQMRKHLDEIGVQKGRFQFLMGTPEKIQKSLTTNIQSITWVGVELNGTTFQMKVVEKNEPEKEKYTSPQHIVAKKKAVITRMYVEKGEPLAQVDEHVKKGQMLVSGLIGSEEQKKTVGAKAKIYGETWYRSEVSVPLRTSFDVFTGKMKTKHKLSLFGGSIPFWGFTFKKDDFHQPKTEKEVHPLHFLNMQLPFSYEKEITRESEKIKREYTNKEAVQAGIKMGKKELEEKLGQTGEVKSEKVLHETTGNGKVKLIILYQVIEDIVQPTPIVQGD